MITAQKENMQRLREERVTIATWGSQRRLGRGSDVRFGTEN